MGLLGTSGLGLGSEPGLAVALAQMLKLVPLIAGFGNLS
jgi:hypothetical protein